MRNISVKLFGIRTSGSDVVIKILLIYSSNGPFVQQSGTIYAILVEGIVGKTQ